MSVQHIVGANVGLGAHSQIASLELTVPSHDVRVVDFVLVY